MTGRNCGSASNEATHSERGRLKPRDEERCLRGPRRAVSQKNKKEKGHCFPPYPFSNSSTAFSRWPPRNNFPQPRFLDLMPLRGTLSPRHTAKAWTHHFSCSSHLASLISSSPGANRAWSRFPLIPTALSSIQLPSRERSLMFAGCVPARAAQQQPRWQEGLTTWSRCPAG